MEEISKRERQKKTDYEVQKAVYQTINEALSSNYNNVYLVDIETGNTKAYNLSNEIRKEYGNLFEYGDYSQFIQLYVKTTVYDADKELFDPIIDICKLRESMHEEPSLTFDYRVYRDEKMYHFKCRSVMTQIKDKDYCVMAFRDITREIMRELEFRQYEQLFALTASGIYSGLLRIELDTHHTIRITHREGRVDTSDVGNWEEYVQRQLTYIYPEDVGIVAKGLRIENFSDMTEKDKKVFSYRSKTKNESGHHKSYFTNLFIMNIDGRRYGVTVTIDNTEAVERERKQQKVIEEALAQAEAANRAKTDFLSNMSHDIRTPMNAIIGFATLAETHADEPDQVQDYLKKIMSASNHLLSLINDILDMSRIEGGKIRLEETPCNLSDMMQEVEDILQGDIESKQFDFGIEMDDVTDLDVMCDHLRLNQILLNLLSNSFKFTAPGGKIAVHVSQEPGETEDEPVYEFRVRDNGIGMSEEFVSRVFEPFERERTSTVSGIQGTGLGMSITKNIVDMMQGTITVDSEKNIGTEFVVRLPMRKTSAGKRPGRRVLQKDVEGRRILLVEDNKLNREIASELLTEAGLYIEEAEDGSIAVDMLLAKEAGYYDLVLMDVQMPVMDGYEATKVIRALPDQELAQIPIVAMTANAFSEDRYMAIEAGMNAHVAKPIHVRELFETLQGIL